MKIETKTVPLSKIKLNPANPRLIKDENFKKLCRSLQEFPEMTNIREIVVDENMMIIGGNMRYRALKEIGKKQSAIKVVTGLSEKQKKEFVLKDNSNYGEWDYDILIKDFTEFDLTELNIEIPNVTDVDMTQFERPEFEDRSPKECDKDEKYFYVEFYGDAEMFDKLKEVMGDNMETSNRISSKYFAKLILGK